MPRRRDLDPGFFENEHLCSLPPLTRLFFEGLWCHADREGLLEDRPLKLKAKILPYDQCDGEEMVTQLVGIGAIERYERDGIHVIRVVNFHKHQKHIHPNEERSKLPAPTEPTDDEAMDIHGNSKGKPLDNQGDAKGVKRKPRNSSNSSNSRDSSKNDGSSGNNAPAREYAPPAPEANSDVEDYCSQNLQHMSSGNYAELRELMEAGITYDLAKFAVDQACKYGGRTWGYAEKVLTRCLTSGIRTVGDAKADHEKFKASALPRGIPRQGSPPDSRFAEFERLKAQLGGGSS